MATLAAISVLTALFLADCVSAQDGVGFYQTMSGGATFFGDSNGNGLQGGACGYGDLNAAGYGLVIAAGAAPIYKGGAGCGACYQLKCVNSPFCTGNSIVVPVTDFCPGGSFCCPTCNHFDLSQPSFRQIANMAAGAVDIQYQRVPCPYTGSMRFIVTGSAYWMNILIENVGGPGDIGKVEVAPAGGNYFIPVAQSWGANFAYNGFLRAPLQFRVTSRLNNQVVLTAPDCLPANWAPGTYHCNIQFPGGVSQGPGGGPSKGAPRKHKKQHKGKHGKGKGKGHHVAKMVANLLRRVKTTQ